MEKPENGFYKVKMKTQELVTKQTPQWENSDLCYTKKKY